MKKNSTNLFRRNMMLLLQRLIFSFQSHREREKKLKNGISVTETQITLPPIFCINFTSFLFK